MLLVSSLCFLAQFISLSSRLLNLLLKGSNFFILLGTGGTGVFKGKVLFVVAWLDHGEGGFVPKGWKFSGVFRFKKFITMVEFYGHHVVRHPCHLCSEFFTDLSLAMAGASLGEGFEAVGALSNLAGVEDSDSTSLITRQGTLHPVVVVEGFTGGNLHLNKPGGANTASHPVTTHLLVSHNILEGGTIGIAKTNDFLIRDIAGDIPERDFGDIVGLGSCGYSVATEVLEGFDVMGDINTGIENHFSGILPWGGEVETR